MNVTIPENKIDKKTIILYSIIIGICIISIILVIYMQFFGSDTVHTVGYLKGKSERNYEQLQSEFRLLFNNTVQFDDTKYINLKEDASKDLVYTVYANNEIKDNLYSMDVSIPYINIKNSEVQNFNKEVSDTFQKKAEEMLNTSNKLSIYTVEYGCDIQDGIFSLVIISYLKEGNNKPRTFIKSFNFSLEENRTVDLKEVLNLENVSEQHAQERINKEIELAQKNAENSKTTLSQIYKRDLKSKIYEVSNVLDFYFHDGSIYMIFAYGNEEDTTELDVVVI